MAAATSSTEPPSGHHGASPLSAQTRKRLLRSLRDRAFHGDIAAAEALLRLGMPIAGAPKKTKPKSPAEAAALVRQRIAEASEEIVASQIAAAADGDSEAAQFLLTRLVPTAKSAPVSTRVRLNGTPAENARKITTLVARGRLTLDEAASLLGAIAEAQSIQDADELSARVREIESRLASILSIEAPKPALPAPSSINA